MKKFYSFVIAVAVSATAFAGQRQTDAISLGTPQLIDPQCISEAVQHLKPLRAVSPLEDFATVGDMVGAYDWNYYSMLSTNSGSQSGEISLTVVDAEEGQVALNLSQFGLTATVDLENGTLSIPNRQLLFNDGENDVYFYFKSFDEEGNLISGASEAESVVGTISDKYITFPATSVWAVGYPEDESKGYYLGCYYNILTYVGDEDYEAGWTDCGTGSFTDGWLICAYYNLDEEGNTVYCNPADYPWKVTVQSNDNDPNLFRIYNPYNSEDSPFNFGNGGKGAIVFSVEDPEFVLVYANVYSGVTNSQRRMNFFNLESYYTNAGYTKEEIISGISDFEPSYVDGLTIYFNNCRLNWQTTLESAYIWSYDVRPNMHGGLVMDEPLTSGVENVSVESQDAPVEYYNLQGVRELNPSNGVYIMRRGDKVTKLVIR